MMFDNDGIEYEVMIINNNAIKAWNMHANESRYFSDIDYVERACQDKHGSP